MNSAILVVGGGISGLTAALEAAETGYDVFIAEKQPYLGGRVAQMSRYFPKLCPPYCGLELNFRRLRGNRRVRFFTLSEVAGVRGAPGDFTVTLRLHPRYVLRGRCTACGECVKVCPAERPSDFNYGMDRTRAIYLPHELSLPLEYAIDDRTCLGKDCARCVAACPYNAIDLEMKARELELRVGTLCLATGWKPYDAARIANLGFGKLGNVITNVMMERLAAPNGPTRGRLARPSDGKEAKRVVFVQCAGSRDENYLPYCSAVCCLASLKQAALVREQYPEAQVSIFYIDIRTPGTYEDLYTKVKGDKNVSFIKGKVAKVEEVAGSRDPVVIAEDLMKGERLRVEADLVVLATGMVPVAPEFPIPGVAYDKYGFLSLNGDGGVYAAGVARKPMDVASSTRDGMGAALRSIQCLRMRGNG